MKITITNDAGEEFEVSPEDLSLPAGEIIKAVNLKFGNYSYYKQHELSVKLIANPLGSYLKVFDALNQVVTAYENPTKSKEIG